MQSNSSLQAPEERITGTVFNSQAVDQVRVIPTLMRFEFIPEQGMMDLV